ncbi:hypothetical protein ZIOFF_021402 [Zingiber officinale]|uniref:Uncharacterized protein n=1 Tax=Zingiber officinale TaxID=94328 RepID=A0A8J5HK09_ZINOF|nr:hypothetical protein ZIOFF_021402 [Zingiber officinale]
MFLPAYSCGPSPAPMEITTLSRFFKLGTVRSAKLTLTVIVTSDLVAGLEDTDAVKKAVAALKDVMSALVGGAGRFSIVQVGNGNAGNLCKSVAEAGGAGVCGSTPCSRKHSLPPCPAHQPNLYANFGQLHRALLIFANVCCHSSVVAWKSVIAHISHSCRLLDALCLFPHLHASAAPAPNSHTFSSILPSCIDADADDFDSQVHALVLRNSIVAAVYVASALTDMYPKCDCVWDF